MMTSELARSIDPQSIEFISPFHSLVGSGETLLPKRFEDFTSSRGFGAIGRMFRQALERLNRKYFREAAETPENETPQTLENEGPRAESEPEERTIFKVAPDYGGWKLTQEGSDESIDCALTKAEVEAKAMHLAEQQPGPCSIRIHDREGNFESEVDCGE